MCNQHWGVKDGEEPGGFTLDGAPPSGLNFFLNIKSGIEYKTSNTNL